ncbi:hypothetical protein E2C01_030809 [Portunus trituberculatus]|uniref:Uncharacterized protein n=1 Tax=Portunus trituberculatus TaxID=210409 RepID=A0A5B7EV68_PORTR|nr:hypothetical protein [Portunus trituberculatus]
MKDRVEWTLGDRVSIECGRPFSSRAGRQLRKSSSVLPHVPETVTSKSTSRREQKGVFIGSGRVCCAPLSPLPLCTLIKCPSMSLLRAPGKYKPAWNIKWCLHASIHNATNAGVCRGGGRHRTGKGCE